MKLDQLRYFVKVVECHYHHKSLILSSLCYRFFYNKLIINNNYAIYFSYDIVQIWNLIYQTMLRATLAILFISISQ